MVAAQSHGEDARGNMVINEMYVGCHSTLGGRQITYGRGAMVVPS